MNSYVETLEDIEKKLPPLATAEDLVRAGLFPSISTVNRLRSMGKGPGYFRLSDRLVRYPRESVVKFLKDHWNESQKK